MAEVEEAAARQRRSGERRSSGARGAVEWLGSPVHARRRRDPARAEPALVGSVALAGATSNVPWSDAADAFIKEAMNCASLIFVRTAEEMEPSMGIEPMVSSLPRTCFTTELRRHPAVGQRYSVDGLSPYCKLGYLGLRSEIARAGGYFFMILSSTMLRRMGIVVAACAVSRCDGASRRGADASADGRQDRDASGELVRD